MKASTSTMVAAEESHFDGAAPCPRPARLFALYGKRVQVAKIAYEEKKILYDVETNTMNGRNLI